MNKQDCEIVRDLLPLYIDHVTSEVTSDYVKKHLAECESCSRIYESSKESIQLPNSAEFNASQAMDIKKLKKSMIRRYSKERCNNQTRRYRLHCSEKKRQRC